MMADDKERDEDGFPVFKPSPEEIAKIRERMQTQVDCRKQASDIMARLAPPNPTLLTWLADIHEIDGTKTLTEIEGEDWGDAYDVGDEPEVHALRHIPVAQWPLEDITLMLVYGHGVEIGIALAEWHLRKDVMLRDHGDAWNLIEVFSREACALGKQKMVSEITSAFETEVWANFDRASKTAALDVGEREVQLQRLINGERSAPGKNPFLNIEHELQTLARLKDYVDPLEVLCHATVKQHFAKYRLRKSIELMPLPDKDVPEYLAVLGNPKTFQFRRDTTFTIVKDRDGKGVRLRIVAQSAMEHLQGILFVDVEAAKAMALRDYGVDEGDWVCG